MSSGNDDSPSPESSGESKDRKPWCLIAAIVSFSLIGVCTVLAIVAGSSTGPATDPACTSASPCAIRSITVGDLNRLRLAEFEEFERDYWGEAILVSGRVCSNMSGYQIWLDGSPGLWPGQDVPREWWYLDRCERHATLEGFPDEAYEGVREGDRFGAICRVKGNSQTDTVLRLDHCILPYSETAFHYVTATPTVTPLPTATPGPIRVEISGMGRAFRTVELSESGDYLVTINVSNNQTCSEPPACQPAQFEVTMQHEEGDVIEDSKALVSSVVDRWEATRSISISHSAIFGDFPPGNLFVSVSAVPEAEWYIVFEETGDAGSQ